MVSLKLNINIIKGFYNNCYLDHYLEIGLLKRFRILISSFLKFGFFLFYLSLGTTLNSVIPLSLDSFNNYGEKTLENIWSFDEVITLEIILLIILLTLSQIPLFILIGLNNEKEKNILPEFWKPLSFIIFIVSGLLTPTIDGYTQLSFAFSSLSLYLIIILILSKRIDLKFNTVQSIAF